MTKSVTSGCYYPYLLFCTVVTLSTTIIGCSEKLPEISLEQIRAPSVTSGPISPVYQLAPFSAHSPRHAHYAQFLTDYLTQQLTEKQQLSELKSPPTTSEQVSRLILTGKVNISHWAALAEPSKTVVKTEITFEISNPTGSVVQSTMLAQTASPATEEAIRTSLRQTADLYLARLFPEPQTFTVSLARGRTEFDRQGRQAAARGEYSNALNYFIKAIDARPDDHGALYNAAVMSQALGDYPRALNYIKRALQLSDKNEYQIIYYRIQRSFNEK